MKKLWTVMTVLAVMVAIYAVAILLIPGMGPPFVVRLRRLYLVASALAGLSFETAYPAIAWLCWIPNLLVAELFILRGREAAAPAV